MLPFYNNRRPISIINILVACNNVKAIVGLRSKPSYGCSFRLKPLVNTWISIFLLKIFQFQFSFSSFLYSSYTFRVFRTRFYCKCDTSPLQFFELNLPGRCTGGVLVSSFAGLPNVFNGILRRGRRFSSFEDFSIDLPLKACTILH